MNATQMEKASLTKLNQRVHDLSNDLKITRQLQQKLKREYDDSARQLTSEERQLEEELTLLSDRIRSLEAAKEGEPNMLISLARALERTYAAYVAYDDGAKKRFHTAATAFFKKLITTLNLKKGEFNLRTNPAGIAVLGDTTLHTNHWYFNASEGMHCAGPGAPYQMLVRTSEGQKDYTGGPNQYFTPTQIAKSPEKYLK